MQTLQLHRLTFALALLLTSVTAFGQAKPNTLAVGLSGYSPVSYFEQNQPHYGSPAFRAEHRGVGPHPERFDWRWASLPP